MTMLVRIIPICTVLTIRYLVRAEKSTGLRKSDGVMLSFSSAVLQVSALSAPEVNYLCLRHSSHFNPLWLAEPYEKPPELYVNSLYVAGYTGTSGVEKMLSSCMMLPISRMKSQQYGIILHIILLTTPTRNTFERLDLVQPPPAGFHFRVPWYSSCLELDCGRCIRHTLLLMICDHLVLWNPHRSMVVNRFSNDWQ